MLGGPERAPGIDRDNLVDAVAKDEPAVEHRYACLLRGHEFSVQIDDLAHHSLPGSRGPVADSPIERKAGWCPSRVPGCRPPGRLPMLLQETRHTAGCRARASTSPRPALRAPARA